MANGKSILEKQEPSSNEANPLTEIKVPTWGHARDRVGTERNLAVFPELPAPLKRVYIYCKDLNSIRGENRADMSAEELGLSINSKPAVEIGLKFSF